MSSSTVGSDHERSYAALRRRFSEELWGSQLVSVVGPTTLYTPTADKGLLIKYVALGLGAFETQCVVTLKLGATTIYQWPLGSPGAYAHAGPRSGAIDDPFTITLSTGSAVYINWELEEFTR